MTFERIAIGDKNAARLPNYHRLDLAVNHVWNFPSNRTATLGVTAFNAYDRANVWYPSTQASKAKSSRTISG